MYEKLADKLDTEIKVLLKLRCVVNFEILRFYHKVLILIKIQSKSLCIFIYNRASLQQEDQTWAPTDNQGEITPAI